MIRPARLSYADLTTIVVLVNDRGSRGKLTYGARCIRALCVRELRRREAVTEQAIAILRGLSE